jgi:hypothetical protein
VFDIAELAPAALRAAQGVTVAGQAAEAGALRGQAAQIPLTREQINLMLAQLTDEPSRIAAERRLLGAQGGALAAGQAERAATAALADVTLVVNANGTVRLAEDAIQAAAQSAFDQVEKLLREGLAESSQGGVPASDQLAGARR